MKKALLLALIITLSSLSPSHVSALSCAIPDATKTLSPKKNIDANQYVFSGTITSKQRKNRNTDTSFAADYISIKVNTWLKGATTTPVRIVDQSINWGDGYPTGTKAVFLFKNKDISNKNDFANTTPTLAFTKELCPATENPQIVTSVDKNYTTYKTLIEQGYSGQNSNAEKNGTLIQFIFIGTGVLILIALLYLRKKVKRTSK